MDIISSRFVPGVTLKIHFYGTLMKLFYPLQLIENECFKFEEQICDFEDDSTNPAVPDDIRDSILAAIGKARLLMAQKLAQFRGLCEKNIVRFLDQNYKIYNQNLHL